MAIFSWRRCAALPSCSVALSVAAYSAVRCQAFPLRSFRSWRALFSPLGPRPLWSVQPRLAASAPGVPRLLFRWPRAPVAGSLLGCRTPPGSPPWDPDFLQGQPLAHGAHGPPRFWVVPRPWTMGPTGPRPSGAGRPHCQPSRREKYSVSDRRSGGRSPSDRVFGVGTRRACIFGPSATGFV